MATTSELRNVTFDDRDRINFQYDGQWDLNGVWNATNVGMSGTLSSTNDPHANVTFKFPRPAVAFYYYGIPRSNGGLYGICIDCDPKSGVFQPINAVNLTDDGKNPPVVLFSKRFKAAGVHEIILINQKDTRFDGNSQLTLDRFVLEVMDDGTAGPILSRSASFPSRSSQTLASSSTYNSSTISALTESNRLSSSSTTLTKPTYSSSGSALWTQSLFSISPPSPLTSNNIKIKSSSSSSTPIAGIVGGIVGAFALLLFILLLLFWLRIRRLKALALLKIQTDSQYHPCDTSQADSSQLTEDLPYSLMKDSASTYSDPSVVSVSEGYGVGIGKDVGLKGYVYRDE